MGWLGHLLNNGTIPSSNSKNIVRVNTLKQWIVSILVYIFCYTFWWWLPFHSGVDMESNMDILIFLIFVFPQSKRLHWSNKASVGCTDFSSQLPTVSPCPHGAWRRQHLLWRVGPGWKMLDHRLVPCISFGDLVLDSHLKHWTIIHHVFWTIISVVLSYFSATSELQVVVWAARLSLLALSAIIYYSVSGGPYGAEVWTRRFPSKYLQGMNHESWSVCIQYISWMVGDYSRYLIIWWLVVLIQLYNLIQHIRLLFDITYLIRQFFSMSTSAGNPPLFFVETSSISESNCPRTRWHLLDPCCPWQAELGSELTLFNKKVVQRFVKITPRKFNRKRP